MDNERQFLEMVEADGFDKAILNYGHLLKDSEISGEYYDYMDARNTLAGKINIVIRRNITLTQFEEIV